MLNTISLFALLGSILAILFSLFVLLQHIRQIKDKERKKIYGQRERIEDKIYEWREIMQESPERFFDTNKLLLQYPDKELTIRNKVPNYQFFDNLGININNVIVNEKSVLCLMPFNDRYMTIYHSIFYACERSGLVCSRSDDDYYPGYLLRQIVTMMLQSSIIIALLDGQNPNVFYEVGIAHSIGKTVLLLANNKNKSEIPFDLKSDRLLLYSNSEDLHKTLYKVLKEMHYVDKGE